MAETAPAQHNQAPADAAVAYARAHRVRLLKERAIRLVFVIAGISSIAIVALILLFLLKDGLPFLGRYSFWSFITGTTWSPTATVPEFGLLPILTGTLAVTAIAIALSLPIGVGAALYLSEVAGPWEREIVKPLIEALAAIPSVVMGFFGYVVLGQIVRVVFNAPVEHNALTGGIILALMAVPTIVTISEDAMRSVPKSFREGSLALGASRWETAWRVTLPASASGVTAATMLGLGRAVGETMAVLMCTGNAPVIPTSVLLPIRTMTATIAAEMGEVPYGSAHYHALFMVGAALFVLTLAINTAARKAIGRFQFKGQ